MPAVRLARIPARRDQPRHHASRFTVMTFITGNNLPHNRHRFMMMEVIGAAVVLGILLSCCFSMFRLIRQMQVEFGRRSEALIVLDNTLERVSGETSCDFEQFRRILDDEFGRSVLSTVREVRTVVVTEEKHICVRIVGTRERSLGDIRIPRQE